MAGELKTNRRTDSGARILAKLNALGAVGAAFADDVFAIAGSSDATKKLRVEVDGFTTATTRVATFPNADITVASINVAQTFSAAQTYSSTATYDTSSTGITLSRATGTTITVASTAAASVTTAGGYTSTVATGTAPFTATSTTACPNLNASLLLGSTWAIPGSIGATTPAAGAFTTLTASGAVSLATGSSNVTVGSNAATSAVISFNAAASQQRGFSFATAGVNVWSVVSSGTESGGDAGAQLLFLARTDAGSTIDIPIVLTRVAGANIELRRPVLVTTASSGLTIGITTGTSLVVSSTAASTTTTSGCATYAGGVGVAGRLCAGSLLASGLTSGRIPYASTGGLLADTSNLLWDNGNTILQIGASTGACAVDLSGAAANNRLLRFRTAAVNRWILNCNNTAEGGANAGSDFVFTAYDDAGSAIDSPLTILRVAAGAMTIVRPLTLSTASSGLTISKTTGTTLVVSSTGDATLDNTATGSVTLAGGLGVAKKVVAQAFQAIQTTTFQTCYITNSSALASGKSSSLYLTHVDSGFGAGCRAFGMASVVAADATNLLYEWTYYNGSVYNTFLRYRGALASTGQFELNDTTDATTITSGSLVVFGGIAVAKRVCLDGATGKTLKYVNGTANAAVGVTFGAVGPTGSTAGNQQGWLRVDINGTDRYIPYW